MDIKCPDCGEEIHIENGWECLGDEFTCPACNIILELNYDDIYDSESGEDNGFFYFEIVC